MRNKEYSERELMTQACALYIDSIANTQPRKQRKSLRDRLFVIGDLNQKTFPLILKNAKHMEQSFISYLNEMERVASQAIYPDSKEHLRAIPSYQNNLTKEFAEKLGVNPEEFAEELYLLNELYFDFITPKTKAS